MSSALQGHIQSKLRDLDLHLNLQAINTYLPPATLLSSLLFLMTVVIALTFGNKILLDKTYFKFIIHKEGKMKEETDGEESCPVPKETLHSLQLQGGSRPGATVGICQASPAEGSPQRTQLVCIQYSPRVQGRYSRTYIPFPGAVFYKCEVLGALRVTFYFGKNKMKTRNKRGNDFFCLQRKRRKIRYTSYEKLDKQVQY